MQEPKLRYKLYLDYIRNTGGSVTVDQFKEDWEPIGYRVLCDMIDTGLIEIDKGVVRAVLKE